MSSSTRPSTHSSDDARAEDDNRPHAGTVPSEEYPQKDIGKSVRGYLFGLALAALLIVCSFAMMRANCVRARASPLAIIVFAIAQMGTHLMFFLHITTGPDNIHNVVALAFGEFFVVLLISGSVWIMNNIIHNMTLHLSMLMHHR